MSINWVTHRRNDHNMSKAREFLKQIVYGGNDGIVTTFAIVAGFAGASADGAAQIGTLAVLVFGLANLFADGVSMGLGEFLSSRSHRDLYNAHHAREQGELVENPEQERTEILQLMEERGLPETDATAITDILMRNPGMAADIMMAYEFEMTDPRSTNEFGDALATFMAFITLGAIPLLPYLVGLPQDQAFAVSVAATFVALLALGGLRWWATGERPLRSIGETVLVGTICSAVAFAVGALVAGG